VLVDQDGDITIKENEFRCSEELWGLLTRKNVNKEQMTSDDLSKYEKILPKPIWGDIKPEVSLMSVEA